MKWFRVMGGVDMVVEEGVDMVGKMTTPTQHHHHQEEREAIRRRDGN